MQSILVVVNKHNTARVASCWYARKFKYKILNSSGFVWKTEITLTFKPTNLTLQKQVQMLCLYVCLFVKVINWMCVWNKIESQAHRPANNSISSPAARQLSIKSKINLYCLYKDSDNTSQRTLRFHYKYRVAHEKPARRLVERGRRSRTLYRKLNKCKFKVLTGQRRC